MKIYLTQENLKQNSLSTILNYITENDYASRRDIQASTGFSWGTVSECAAELLNKGYLSEEKDTRKSGAGRTGYVLKPSGDKIVSIGLDINKMGMRAEVIGFDRQRKHVIYKDFNCAVQSEVLEEAAALCDAAFEFCEGKFTVMSIGLAVQGSVDSKNGVSIRFPLKSGWISCSLKQIFEEKYRVFTYVDHDPKCMLFAKAYELKKAQGEKNDLMLIRIDKGIGLSVMQDGRISDDTDKMELAHTVAEFNGLECSCGRRGCLEAYSSISGIVNRSSENFEKILKNREKYSDILDDAAKYLAIAIHNSAMLFYPDIIILTGGLPLMYGEFADKLSEYFYELEKAQGRKKIKICVDTEISAAFGAAIKSSIEAIKNLKL